MLCVGSDALPHFTLLDPLGHESRGVVPVPHLGITVELALVVKAQVSWP